MVPFVYHDIKLLELAGRNVTYALLHSAKNMFVVDNELAKLFYALRQKKREVSYSAVISNGQRLNLFLLEHY